MKKNYKLKTTLTNKRNLKQNKNENKRNTKDYLLYSYNDPNGSYTGISENPNEKPVQDADDL